MSDEEKSTGEAAVATADANIEPAEQPYDDEHTTEPNAQDEPPAEPKPAAPSKWEMPKPVFKQTSGYLPQGYVTDMQAAARESPEAENTTREQRPMTVPEPAAASAPLPSAPAAPAANIEPQPDLSDQLIPEPDLETAPEPPKKSSSRRGPIIALVVVGFLIFVAVFLTVIYRIFLTGSGDTNNF